MIDFTGYDFTDEEQAAIQAICESWDYESVQELADWLMEEFGDDLFEEDFFNIPYDEDECYSQLNRLHICIYGEPCETMTDEERKERLKDIPDDVLGMFAVLDRFTKDYEEERRNERRKK